MRIDHVAHPCHDPHETHRFYTTVLGLQLVQAYAGKYLLLVYALPEGGSLAFTAGAMPSQRNAAEWQYQHVGLVVDTRAEFERWLRRLTERGVPYRLVDDERIYFSDPDGMVLEIEVASPLDINVDAAKILAHWKPEAP